MDNTQTPQPTPPEFQPQQPTAPATTISAKKKSYKWPIILMVWPTILIVIAIIGYAISNFAFSSVKSTSDEIAACQGLTTVQKPVDCGQDSYGDLFGEQNSAKTVINVILFIIGAASIALGPISFIVGLVLLILAVNENKKHLQKTE